MKLLQESFTDENEQTSENFKIRANNEHKQQNSANQIRVVFDTQNINCLKTSALQIQTLKSLKRSLAKNQACIHTININTIQPGHLQILKRPIQKPLEPSTAVIHNSLSSPIVDINPLISD